MSEIYHKTLQIENIYAAIKRASKWQHNSYYWDNEWDWIEKELKIADDLLKQQQSRIKELEDAVRDLGYATEYHIQQGLSCECDLSVDFVCADCCIDRDYNKHKDLIESIKTTKDER